MWTKACIVVCLCLPYSRQTPCSECTPPASPHTYPKIVKLWTPFHSEFDKWKRMDGKTMVCPPSAFKTIMTSVVVVTTKKLMHFTQSLLFNTLLNYSLEKGESNLLHHSLYYFLITQLQSHTLMPIPFLMKTRIQSFFKVYMWTKSNPPPQKKYKNRKKQKKNIIAHREFKAIAWLILL